MRRARTLAALSALAAVLALSLSLVACSGSDEGDGGDASASPQAQAYTIGITQIVTHPALDASVEGFKQGLAEKGFTNVTYEVKNAEGDMATASSIAQAFASEDLDLILGVATPTSQAVAKAVTTTPIVFTAVTDPVGAGLVDDPEAPGANVTGVSDMLPVKPHLDLIKQIVPDVKTIGVLYNAGEANSVFSVEQEKKAAAAMGLKVVEATASNSSEVKAAADSLVGRVDAISVLTDNTVVSALESVVKVCQQNDIPLISGDTDSVKRGSAAAYAFDYKDLGVQAGYIAAEILSGTPIAEIPVQFAESLQLSVNPASAKAMGVTLPEDVLAKADNIFGE
ncbi:MAG TPA: ABC transporter substrate-binding protein [Thermoleophilia bacterium]|nr:ABC transporter substrate-binding protein [Thermoleophilia bacterium]HQG53987.1 ABC transporter substrate-binding protein [Thermoleophilia bacterium]